MLKKAVISVLLLALTAHAEKYSQTVFRMHANILPRVVLMDYNFKKKLIDNKIVITVVYETEDYYAALQLKQFIEDKFRHGINHIPVEIELLEASSLSEKNRATIFYLLQLDKTHLKKLVHIANTHDAVTFSYDKRDLHQGINLSTILTKTIKIIINIESLKENNITFRPVMISSSEVFRD